MTLAFVSEYTFGIGLAISIPLIVLALSLDQLSYGIGQIRKWIQKPWQRTTAPPNTEITKESQIRYVEQTLSRARSMRRSVEVSDLQWNGILPAPRRQLSGLTQDGPPKRSWDIERGVRYAQ